MARSAFGKASSLTVFAAATILCAAVMWRPASAQGWKAGRATWFDVGDIKQANCHFSADEVADANLVAAWSDQVEGFDQSCGKCYEVRCKPSDVQDGYGQTLGRTDACYSADRSVVVTIADACPCDYPNNEHSNRRWCCGDMTHLDLSAPAFSQLADPNLGVIALEYREVACGSSGNSGSSSGASQPQQQQEQQPQQQQEQQPQQQQQAAPSSSSSRSSSGRGGWFRGGRW